jgi:hypothetical protein
MFSLRKRGKLQYQDNWEGRYRNGRVACLDYTQLRQHAASDVLCRYHSIVPNPHARNTNCNPSGHLLL